MNAIGTFFPNLKVSPFDLNRVILTGQPAESGSPYASECVQVSKKNGVFSKRGILTSNTDALGSTNGIPTYGAIKDYISSNNLIYTGTDWAFKGVTKGFYYFHSNQGGEADFYRDGTVVNKIGAMGYLIFSSVNYYGLFGTVGGVNARAYSFISPRNGNIESIRNATGISIYKVRG